MQSDDGRAPAAQVAAPPESVSATQAPPTKQDLISQIQSSNTNSSNGILAQLTSNPFFTAVRVQLTTRIKRLTIPGIRSCLSRRRRRSSLAWCATCSIACAQAPAGGCRDQCSRPLLRMLPVLDDAAPSAISRLYGSEPRRWQAEYRIRTWHPKSPDTSAPSRN